MGWNSLVAEPLQAQIKETTLKTDQVDREIRGVVLIKKSLVNNPYQDPNVILRKELKQIQSELANLERGLKRAENNLSTPGEMALTLEQLLNGMEGLTLLDMQTLPSEKLELDKIQSQIEKSTVKNSRSSSANSNQTLDNSTTLYRQDLVLNFSGDYLNTLNFLETVEALPMTLFWNSIDYSLTNNKSGQVKLALNTLSFIDSFIGVN